MLCGCARTIPSRRGGRLLRCREFQTVRGTGCLREQEVLRGIVPPRYRSFSPFLNRQRPENGVSVWGIKGAGQICCGSRRRGGTASLASVIRDSSDARSGVVLWKSQFWCRFTVTRPQSLAAMQAAARKSKGAGVAAGAGFTGKFPAR